MAMVEQQSLKQILEASRTTVEEANARLDSLPARSERRQSKLPQTFTEASQYVQTKEDEKKKREAKKDKQKQRGSVQSTDVVPGLMPGPPDSSPFWIVTEVVQIALCPAFVALTTFACCPGTLR